MSGDGLIVDAECFRLLTCDLRQGESNPNDLGNHGTKCTKEFREVFWPIQGHLSQRGGEARPVCVDPGLD